MNITKIMLYTYRCFRQVLKCKCYEVQKRWGNTMKLTTPKRRPNMTILRLFVTLAWNGVLTGMVLLLNWQENCRLIHRVLQICIFVMSMYVLVKNPLNIQLIHPPMTIIGRTLVTLPFNMSVIILGSVIGFYNII